MMVTSSRWTDSRMDTVGERLQNQYIPRILQTRGYNNWHHNLLIWAPFRKCLLSSKTFEKIVLIISPLSTQIMPRKVVDLGNMILHCMPHKLHSKVSHLGALSWKGLIHSILILYFLVRL